METNIKVTTEAVQKLREMTSAGVMDCRKALIEANGDVLACTDTARPEAVANVRRDGLIRALELTRPAGCNSCWGSARVEFNHAAALRIEPIVNILRTR